MTLNERIGYELRSQRLLRRMTIQQVANKLGKSKNTVSYYELGKIKLKNLSKDKLLIVRYAFNTGSIETQIAARLIGKSTVYSRRLLKELEKEGIFVWHGTSKNDPTQYYTFNFDNK